jgi:hypothetical protein
MLLQSVMAETNLAKKLSETFGFATLSAAKMRSSNKSIAGSNKQNQTYNHF